MLSHWYQVASVLVAAYFLANTVANILYLRGDTRKARLTHHGPFVSVIVPARNEERSIARCLDSLLVQDYADYEVIVVDDESEDATAEVAAAHAAHDPRARLVSAGPLPDGWLGKPHALAKGADVARGEILLLTDADTHHEPTSVSWAVTNLGDHEADMLSGYLRQQYGSVGESLIVPTMYLMMLLAPLFLIRATRTPAFTFAIGQYVAIRREALDAVGGFESIKDSIVDDMSMAKRVKELGFRQVFLDAKNTASVRLYSGYRSAFTGIERSIYSALGASPATAVVVAAVVLAFIVWPALAVLVALVEMHVPPTPLAAAFLLFAAQWGLIAADRDVPFTAFALYPLVFMSLLAILLSSMLATGFGEGVEWKGRLVRVRHAAREEGAGPVGTPRPRAGS